MRKVEFLWFYPITLLPVIPTGPPSTDVDKNAERRTRISTAINIARMKVMHVTLLWYGTFIYSECLTHLDLELKHLNGCQHIFTFTE